jgi:proliferating cell nuclear antigen
MNLEMSSKSFTVFRDFVTLLKMVNEELTLYVDETGIQARGMDPSHVAMIDAKILPGLFEVFEPSEKMITVNLAEFDKFLGRLDKGETPKIQYNADKARITILSRKGGRSRRFSLPVLEPYDEEVPEPKIFFKAEGRILTQSVDRAIKDANLVSEHVKFVLDQNVLKIEATGDMGSADNEFERGGDELLELKVEEEGAATFTLSYLADMFGRLKSLADVVTIELSTDMPLKVEATPSVDPNLEIKLFLAPCIGV